MTGGEHELDASLPDFRTLFEAAPGSFLILAPDLRIVAVTDAYLRDTMTTRDGLLGRHVFDAFPDNPNDAAADGVQNLRMSMHEVLKTRRPHLMAVQKYDIRRPASQGGGFEERYWSPVNSPVLTAGGEVAYIIHKVEDVTDAVVLKRQRSEDCKENEELRQRVERTEAEILLRAQDLQRLNRELTAAMRVVEQANLAKSEFLSRMSHELRTPLNAVLGFAQVLEMSELTSEQSESVQHIMRGGKHLLDLINEILDLARIEAGRLALSMEPVDAAEVARAALELVSPMAATQRIQLEADSQSVFVHADHQRLMQVLVNLVANAVKYSPPGSRVRVLLQKATAGRHRIVVSDNGAGIRPEGLARLFTPFDRLGAERGGVEGTGLGLALSKGLVDAMGGTIAVASVVGEGTTFTIELAAAVDPLLSAVRSESRSTPVTAGALPLRTLLYIEDNASNLKLVKRVLGHRPSIRILAAVTGAAGIELAAAHHPDIILLDLNLPDMAGVEVMRQLQAGASTNSIPVLVLSADATTAQIRRTLAAGARAYLTKPLDVRQMLETIDDMLYGRPAEPVTDSKA